MQKQKKKHTKENKDFLQTPEDIHDEQFVAYVLLYYKCVYVFLKPIRKKKIIWDHIAL